jgi:hypothetical protein
MAVQTPSGAIAKDRTLGALADGQIDGPGGARRQRDGDDLAGLAHDGEGPMATLEAERLDVGAQRLGDPQPVDRQQQYQRVPGRSAEAGGHQQGADLVAVQADRVGLVVEAGRRTCAAGEWASKPSSSA